MNITKNKMGKRDSPALPEVSKPILTQQVVFCEKISSQASIWNSKRIKLFGNFWTFRLIQSDRGVEFRIKFEGPEVVYFLEEIVLVFGGSSIKKYELIPSDMKIEVAQNVAFKKLEARMIRDICSVERLEELKGENDILEFSVYFSSKKVPTSVVKKASRVVSNLESQLAEVTKERNTLHKSMHDLTATANQVSKLTESHTTQPEVIKAFESFCQSSRDVVLTVLAKYSPEDFGRIMSGLVKRIKRRVKVGRTEKYKKLADTLGFSAENELIATVVDDAFKQILRAAGHNSLDRVSEEDVYELEQIIETSELKGFVKEKEKLVKFAKFIYGLIKYMYGNTNLFVNWEEFGMFVKFDRNKYKSMTRRVRANEDCFVTIPRLQRKPFGGRKIDPNEYEALCFGLVCPV